ncbi:hypothetical protein PoB_004797100 [Plakobranchus ocellatus]|uniref:Uncharacterized protein n=1 Tax=Plakobranchus ocellatus TaxID=259542 RepID=A0AAV4BQY0_9GAST|nr:hypothetical protein PoB_004797100 [Plakobranchus ocellatus]
MDKKEENLLTQANLSAEGVSQVPLISAATSHAAVLAKDPQQVTQADRPRVVDVLDGHFYLDLMLGEGSHGVGYA